ncbi:UDP:flavonoid glycosyltransferase YjiC, YdhE family [Singulisphaera sp. GP187]|uniref:glycosyltransferase n=1 Tax=Singulisphaera sp. GP187 TaxID=1882752 RepID=UPI00092938DC|nr:glycosyltransferase [Singulisphaera sp. GP187]SIN72707.1 UDP:flavonoid glycosyltransferase YjiC, YdhE family [Singulisphaera sp. GP187]
MNPRDLTKDGGEVGSVVTARRIVLATFGSLGDLHPFIALAKELQARGHVPVIATSAYHRERIERQGIEFYPVRPDLLDVETKPEFFRELMDRKKGSENVIRQVFMPSLRESYDDLRQAVQGADLLVSHMIAFAGPIVAETTGIPWISAVLSPISLLSKHDPSVPPQAPWLRHLRSLGPRFHGSLHGLARLTLRKWTEPVQHLRQELGLPAGADPLFEGGTSPTCMLVFFSKVLGEPQPDWPSQAVQTGFAFFDDVQATGMTAELKQFLSAGPPPIVFTLGSSAVMDAGTFYERSRAAAEQLDRRAVFLIGIDPRNLPREPLPESMLALEYAPYSELFPRASAIVHQGGVGTTAQALRAGRPMLVVPWAHDQPDNAYRVCRLGVARTLTRDRYTVRRAATALRHLLDEPTHITRASEVGRIVRAEEGAASACLAIERALAVR